MTDGKRTLRIGIYGSDGSGKTTVVNSLKNKLEVSGCLVSSRHWRPYLISKPRNITDINNPHSVKRVSTAKSILKTIFYGLDFWIGWLSDKYSSRRRDTSRQVIVNERYLLDVIFDARRFGLSLPVWMEWLPRLICPPVDLNVGLVGDAKKLFERKPETSPGEIQKQCERIRMTLGRMGNATLLDTVALSVDQTVDELEKLIEGRFSTK